jgi:hypothetical protein
MRLKAVVCSQRTRHLRKVSGNSYFSLHEHSPGGKRWRRIGIVAVARKCLIARWRFLKTGVGPDGAVRKKA